MIPEPEDTFSMPSSDVVLDQVEIAFDDQQAVASAGLLLPATLAERALAQADAEQRHRTNHKELALPVLKRLEPELRGGQEPTNRNRLLAVGQLFLVELRRAPAAWTAKQARKIANKTSANECS
jgi:hypothetical protein